MVRSAGYIAYIMDKTCIKNLVVQWKGRKRPLTSLDIVGKIILKRILEEIGCHDTHSGQLINDRIQNLDICKVVVTLRFP
jgi:hypothetical protein